MYRAGLRVGEVLALKPRDVDLRGTIRIEDGKGGDGTAYFDAASVAPLLEQWKRERKRLGAKADAPLFCTLKGGAVSVRQVEAMVKRRARRAGITSAVTPHVLRHSFATELLEEGFNIRQVQEAVRHADVSTTMLYTHVYDAQLRNKIQSRKR
jgi:integrase/recombinase XerD